MVQLVRYYHILSGRNAGFVVAFGNWPERVLMHRGWTPKRCVCERVATEAEHEWLASCMRFQAIRYDSLEGLVEDESRIVDSEVLKRITAALESAAAGRAGKKQAFNQQNNRKDDHGERTKKRSFVCDG